MDAVRVRPMREDDLASAERASAATFFEAESSTRRVNDPEVEPRSAAASKQWIDRMRFFLDVDPGGCWVAVQEDAGDTGGEGMAGPVPGEVVGFAVSQNRGGPEAAP
ncbi:hypothetical protein AB0M38_24445 [Streptomyces sp. NPDC051742]|uniref:hypothetical protein n=1 Tax=Streptomyces sp. NPDC051742 TaxID=3155169 RepID=UPI003419322D